MGVLLGSQMAWNPLGYLSYQPVKSAIAWAAVFMLCVGVAGRRRTITLPVLPLIAVGSFAAVLLISFAANEPSWVKVEGWLPRALGLAQWFLLFAFFVAGLTCRSAWRRLLPWIEWAAIATGTVGVAQLFGVQPVQGGAVAERIGTVFGSAASAGAFAALLLPLIVDNLIRPTTSRMASTRSAAAAGLTVAMIVATGSRTAVVGAVVGLSVIMLCRRGRSTRRLAAVACGSVVLLFLIVNYDRVHTIGDSGSTARGRVQLWHAAVDAAKGRPLLGYGPESTRSVLPRFLPETFEATFGDTVIEDRAHNALLDIQLVAGALGVAAFLALAGVVAMCAYRGRAGPFGAGIAGLLAAYAVHLSTNFVATEPDVAAWFFGGVAAQAAVVPFRRFRRSIRLPSGLLILAMVMALIGAVVATRQVVADALIRRGVDLEHTNSPGALDEFRRATSWSSEQPYTWEFLARAELRAGLLEDAAVSASRSLSAAGEDVRLLELAADIDLERALMSGDPAALGAAEQRYERLSELAEFDGSIRSGLGAAIAAQGRLEEALTQLRRATELSPSNVTAWVRRAVVEDALRLCDESHVSFEIARDLPGFVAPKGAPACSP